MNGEASLSVGPSPDRVIAAGRPRSSDLMNVLAQLEAEFPTNEWCVGNISVWPLVRIRWFFGEWIAYYNAVPPRQSHVGGAAAHVKRAVTGALAAARARWCDAKANDPARDQRDVVFLSDGLSFANLRGRWVERFCDPLLETANTLGLRGALWTPLHQYHVPRLTHSQFVQPGVDRATLMGELRARAGVHAYLPGRDRMVEWLAARGFGTDALHRSKIVSDGCRVRAVADFYRRKFERVQPRLAFLVNYYSVEGMAFVLACHECGIMATDIQHGVQGELHPAYAAWPRLERHVLLPDRFWVWSSSEAQAIARWSDGTSHAALVGGNPWAEVWRSGSTWPGANEARSRAQQLRAAAGPRPVVLVTLQFGLSHAEQLDGVARLLRAAADQFTFWVRLHPLMLDRREEVRKYLASAGAFELDECTDLPLHALLPFADVHVTHSSSTVIEAAQFGLKSVLTSAYGAELFVPQLTCGIAFEHTGSESNLVALLAKLASGRSNAAVEKRSVEVAFRALLADAAHRELRA